MTTVTLTQRWRPAYHHSPAAHWMNDPNGLLLADGVYHLYYQYHPHSAVWGPMHWGHATSTDLLHWTEQPVALAPDARGMVFSGCVLVDAANTSGLGPPGSAPWVAVFTQHDDRHQPALQTQGLAISLDGGCRWTMHSGNPVLPNPGAQDFRDPKVFWHASLACWVMVLAVGDHLRFYQSPDLQRWVEAGRFGPAGAGCQALGSGVWECPDLFALPTTDGGQRWVLLISVVKGGPNGGSGTQYFVGDFDGRSFRPDHPQGRWLDHGPDNYAGITWAGTAPRVLHTGWMSNWDYAAQLPTSPWRGAMTLPRTLHLVSLSGQWHVASRAATEVAAGLGLGHVAWPLPAAETGTLDLSDWPANGRGALSLVADAGRSLCLTLHSPAGDRLSLGFDAAAAVWFIDRRGAGEASFHSAFARRAQAPRLATEGSPLQLWVALDSCSVELFADDGLTVLTCLCFPSASFDRAQLSSPQGLALQSLSLGGARLEGACPAESER